jgi:ribosome-binding protein aMBF1 (putative translation factor)
MIQNEKQYRISRAQLARFEGAIESLDQQKRPSDVSPRLWKAQREAAESQAEELREQIRAYEALQSKGTSTLVLEEVKDLPKTLIEARIAARMTQEGLAKQLGLKTQQVQRYEATRYQSAGFGRIQSVVEALGLRLEKPARLKRSA